MASDDSTISMNNVNDHEVIQAFRSHNPPLNGYTRSLVDVKNNLFYLFDISTGCILVTRSISFLHDTNVKGYQVFEPVLPLHGDVSDLKAADSFGQVALITSHGLYIVYLPHVQRLCNLPTSHDNVSQVSTWLYAPEDHRFGTFFDCEVRQARWDPHKSFHLVALFSDNSLRIINTTRKKTIKTVSLNEQSLPVVSMTAHAVDFDFLSELSGDKEVYPCSKCSNDVWGPLVVLQDNGDILRIKISTNYPSQVEKVTVMPTPPSSACALIVLNCHPPVIVIAEESGTVYHTIMFQTTNTPVLRVFEQYSLDLGCLSIKPMMATIKFIKDTFSTCRYFVVHDAGIHAALLPVVESITSFLIGINCGPQEYSKLKKSIKNITSDLKCVKHTMLPILTMPQPIYGIGLIPLRLETVEIIILHADATAEVYSVDNIFPDCKFLLKRATINRLTLADNSDFFDIVTTYLKNSRNKRPSIMKVLQAMKNKTKRECFKIFLETTANLRKHGLEECDFIANVISLKELSLRGKLEHQINAIENLSKTKQELKRSAERIAERYEEINEKQISIMNRSKLLGLQIGRFNTIEDKKQVEEFVEAQKKSIQLQTRFNQFVTRLKLVTDQNNKDGNNSDISIDVNNRRCIFTQLKEMDNRIKELKNRIRNIV